MKIHDVQRECYDTLTMLTNRGAEVCGRFEARPETTYFCVKCGYTQYIHLCKEIVEAGQ